MSVRMIKREERLACERIQSVAFVFPMDSAAVEKQIAEEPDPTEYIAYFNEENVATACMELPNYQVMYEGHAVPMVGVGGVASLPEYRFGGAVRQIFEASLRRMVEGGAVFSALYPFSHPYYRQFGYELCQQEREHELPVAALSQFRYRGKARMIQPGEPLDGLKEVFAAHFSRYNLAVVREDSHWARVIGKDPYKERVYTYLLEDEDGPSAYVVLAAEGVGDNPKTGKVCELAFVWPEGLRDVLGFLYRLTAQYEKLLIPLPDDVPLAAMMDESYKLKSNVRNQQMVRVIDVRRALMLLRHPEGAAYSIRVSDDGIPENDGTFRVRCEGGSVDVEKLAEEQDADLTVDVRTLAQLLLGYLSMDEAVYKEDVRVRGQLDVLRRVFVKRAVFLTDHF